MLPSDRPVKMWYEIRGVRHDCGIRAVSVVEFAIKSSRCRSIKWGYDEIEPITYPPTLASSPGTDPASKLTAQQEETHND